MQAFSAVAASWQNFYILCGTAAATLVGLMFVAVTFGANLVDAATSPTVRAFIDPPFTHFVMVLLSACLIVAPSMTAPVLGVLLLAIAALRTLALFRVYGRMRAAQRTHNDLELADWLSGVVFPLLAYVLFSAGGIGFLQGYAGSFNLLAVAIVVVLLLGIFGAWELIIWMAIARARKSG